jgi:hypothetical protein
MTIFERAEAYMKQKEEESKLSPPNSNQQQGAPKPTVGDGQTGATTTTPPGGATPPAGGGQGTQTVTPPTGELEGDKDGGPDDYGTAGAPEVKKPAVANVAPPSGNEGGDTTIDGDKDGGPDDYGTTGIPAVKSTVTTPTIDGDNDPGPDEYGTSGTTAVKTETKLADDEDNIWSLSYDEAVKRDPSITREQWLYNASKWRRENGLNPLSYDEIGLVASAGKDMGKSDEQRAKEERRQYGAELFNSIGSFLANLVNYGRTRAGHAAMKLDDIGKAGDTRLAKIKEYRDKLAKTRYDEYVANETRARAEKAKQDALAAAEAEAQRKMKQWQAELALKVKNSDDDKAIKLAKQDFDQKVALLKIDLEKEKQEIDKTYKTSMAGAAWTRANKESVATSFRIPKRGTYTRGTNLSQLEARDIVNAYGTEAQKKAVAAQQRFGSTPDYIDMASQVIQSGAIPDSELTARGFKKTDSEKGNLLPGKDEAEGGTLLP